MKKTHPDIFDALQTQSYACLRKNGHEKKSEFGIPTAIDYLLQKGLKKVKILKTHDSWFGVTYCQDHPVAQAKIRCLIDQGCILKTFIAMIRPQWIEGQQYDC